MKESIRYGSALSGAMAGGVEARIVTVEAILRRGIPRFTITGLHGVSLRDTAERIRTALTAGSLPIPFLSIAVNLAPVDMKKRGAHLDLAIAAAILAAIGPPRPDTLLGILPPGKTLFLGELSLSGELRPCPAILPILLEAKKRGIRSIVLPGENLGENVVVEGIRYHGISRVAELLESPAPEAARRNVVPPRAVLPSRSRLEYLQLDPGTLQAICVAAAGWHSLLIIGPPGSGKSTLAREMAGLVVPPEGEELLEILAVESIANGGVVDPSRIVRPFRAPHHSATPRSLTGGGFPVEPGETTRAHNGILLLDEFSEFSRASLQSLREPMEEHKITITRGGESITLPARFLLVATTNPCPCGFLGSIRGSCQCDPASLAAYRSRIMGPLRDRIDMEYFLDLRSDAPVDAGPERTGNETSRSINPDQVRKKIAMARAMQMERYRESRYLYNSDVEFQELDRWMPLERSDTRREWERLVRSNRFTHRGLAGIRRLARTVADLTGTAAVHPENLHEAASYHILDLFWQKDAPSLEARDDP